MVFMSVHTTKHDSLVMQCSHVFNEHGKFRFQIDLQQSLLNLLHEPCESKDVLHTRNERLAVCREPRWAFLLETALNKSRCNFSQLGSASEFEFASRALEAELDIQSSKRSMNLQCLNARSIAKRNKKT